MGTEVSLALQRRILARRDVYFLDEYTPSSWDILKCFGSTTINLVGADKFIRHVCSIFFKLSTDLVRSSARLALHAWWGGTHREIWGYVELIQKGFLIQCHQSGICMFECVLNLVSGYSCTCMHTAVLNLVWSFDAV